MSIFSDLVTLAKAGYTPDQVREILKMSNDDSKGEPAKEPEKEPDTKVYTNEKTESGENEPDYKSLYEQTKNELHNIQIANTKDDMSKNVESIDDIIKDIKKAIC